MLHNKKTFLLLLTIPMYIATRAFLLLTFDTGFSVPMLTDFCMFILSAVSLLYAKERTISVQISIVVHLAVIIPVFLNVSTIQYSKEDLLLYALFFLPVLFYFALFTVGDSTSDEDSVSQKKRRTVFASVFYAVLAVLAGVLFWLVTHKKTSLSPKFDINAVFFMMLCLFSVVWLCTLMKRKKNFNPMIAYLIPVLVLSLFETAVYIIWANQFFTVEFEPLFPLVLLIILVIDMAQHSRTNPLRIRYLSVF